MQCKNCGAELPEGARFCAMCATPVEYVAAEPASTPAAQGNTSEAASSYDPYDPDVTGTLQAMPAAKKLEQPLNAGAVPFVPMAPAPRASYVQRRASRPTGSQARPGTAATRPVVSASSPAVPTPAAEINEPQVDATSEKHMGFLGKLFGKKEVAAGQEPAAASAPESAPAASPEPTVDTWPPEEPYVDEDATVLAPAIEVDEPDDVELFSQDAWNEGDATSELVGVGASDMPAEPEEDPFAGFESDSDADATGHIDYSQSPRSARRSYSRRDSVSTQKVIVIVAVLVLAGAVAAAAASMNVMGVFNSQPTIAEDEKADSSQDSTPTQADTSDEEEAEDSGEIKIRTSVEQYTWSELSQISQQIAAASSDSEGLKIAEKYNLCTSDGKLDGTQTKKLELEGGTEVTMRIAGFRHDELTDGSRVSGITFISSTSVGTEPVMDSNEEVGWKDTDLRTWMNTSLLAEMPAEVAEVIVQVDKPANGAAGSGEAQGTTADALWAPSVTELFGELSIGYNLAQTYEPEGTQYQLFSDSDVTYDGNELLAIDGTTDEYWWTRTADSGDAYHNICVSTDGLSHMSHKLATPHSVIMGFCL